MDVSLSTMTPFPNLEQILTQMVHYAVPRGQHVAAFVVVLQCARPTLLVLCRPDVISKDSRQARERCSKIQWLVNILERAQGRPPMSLPWVPERPDDHHAFASAVDTSLAP